MKAPVASTLASLSVFLVSSVALAQDPVGPGSPAPAAAPAQGAQDPAAPAAPGAAVSPGTPAEAPAKPKTEEESARFRWGISGYGGPLSGGLSGGAGGIDTRFGAQITNMFGVYAQPMLLLGAGANASATGASASGIALYGVGVLGDVTLADLIYLAAGPELLFGAMGAASASTTGASASGSTGPYLSLAARAGLALGSVKPNRRKAFTIGLDLRTVLNPGDPVITPCLALGYDSF